MAALYVSGTEQVHSFRFATWNVDMAMREEEHEETRWINRMDRARELIRDFAAHIVCLQEMRHLPQTPSVNSWLSSIPEYEFAIAYRNASPLTFGQAILYRPDSFCLDRIEKRWLSDTPRVISDTWHTNGFGSMILFARFLRVVEGKIAASAIPLWVANVHFFLDEDAKKKSAEIIADLCRDVCGDETCIIAGDFNFFPDRGGNEQRSIICKTFADLSTSAKTLGGRAIEGTFVGFEHDPFKSDLTALNSRLDGIFATHNVSRLGDATLWTKTMLREEPPELTTRWQPSDHLPIVVDLQINASCATYF